MNFTVDEVSDMEMVVSSVIVNCSRLVYREIDEELF